MSTNSLLIGGPVSDLSQCQDGTELSQPATCVSLRDQAYGRLIAMPAGADTALFVADQITERLRRLSSQVKIALLVLDADAVHDLRVAIRRLLQTIATLRAWLVAPRVRTIRRQLKNLLMAAGDVRDCDIAIALLSKSEAKDSTKFGA